MVEAIIALVVTMVICFALIGVKETFFPKERADHSMDRSYNIARQGDRQKWGGK